MIQTMASFNSRSRLVTDLCSCSTQNPREMPEEMPSAAKLVSGHRNEPDLVETHANNDLNVDEPSKKATISPLRINNSLDETLPIVSSIDSSSSSNQKRPLEDLIKLVKQEKFDPTSLSNEEIIELMLAHQVSVHRLESILGRSNAKRCVEIRRQYYCKELELLDKLEDYRDKSAFRAAALKSSINTDFDYERVVGACCENVIGYVRTPVGFAGPLKLDDQLYYVPMATTEGCLVASTSRGLSALAKSGGVTSRVRKDRMTRAPIVTFRDPDPMDALKNVDRALDWLENPINKEKINSAFRSTSKHITHVDYTLYPIDTDIHIRFEAQTGDAMGMNMCSKGAEKALKEMQRVFPTMDILTLSGNMCADKKPSAINWIDGRGKSVQCYATIPSDIVQETFKVSVDSLIEVWNKKVMVGSAMAGSIGGFNCHAANIVSAIFLATGQDLAQNVTSSNCILQLKSNPKGSLQVHCSMPSIECGTVGGGTVLPDQSSYLQLMGIKGSTMRRDQASTESTSHNGPVISTSPAKGLDSDTNACKLARIICATVMAAELSLLASLTEGTLVKSHMTHNRSTQPCQVV